MHKRWGIVVGSSWYIMCEFGGWCGGGKGLWGERSEPVGPQAARPQGGQAGSARVGAAEQRRACGPQKKPPDGGFWGVTMGYLRRSAAAPSKAMSAAAVAVLTKSFAPVVGLLVVLGVSSVGT